MTLMPDLIIHGMEVPENCRKCFAIHLWDDANQCAITKKWVPWDQKDRPDWCPLSPAPEWISVEERTKNDDYKAVELLDHFTKAFCIDATVTDDLAFRCGECPFATQDGKCLVKLFKNQFAPDYKEFGSMGDL